MAGRPTATMRLERTASCLTRLHEKRRSYSGESGAGHSNRAAGKTGVEMEALTGASVAALTVYDMCKVPAQQLSSAPPPPRPPPPPLLLLRSSALQPRTLRTLVTLVTLVALVTTSRPSTKTLKRCRPPVVYGRGPPGVRGDTSIPIIL